MSFKVAILTISDTSARDHSTDRSGPILASLLEEHGDESFKVIAKEIVEDDIDKIQELDVSFSTVTPPTLCKLFGQCKSRANEDVTASNVMRIWSCERSLVVVAGVASDGLEDGSCRSTGEADRDESIDAQRLHDVAACVSATQMP